MAALEGLPVGEGSGPGCGASDELEVAIDLVAGVVVGAAGVPDITPPFSPLPFPFDELVDDGC